MSKALADEAPNASLLPSARPMMSYLVAEE
jgi:hypothetical protein